MWGQECVAGPGAMPGKQDSSRAGAAATAGNKDNERVEAPVNPRYETVNGVLVDMLALSGEEEAGSCYAQARPGRARRGRSC